MDQNKANFLRTGEQVKLIVINRPTGYLAAQTVTVELSAEEGGGIDIPVDKLVLQPPNIKVKAERASRENLNIPDSELKEYLIGSEGAALTSDAFIKVSTEWLDHNGTPLPEDLPGYSGLLAKVVAPGQVAVDGACGSQASKIPIKPGFNLQLLKLNGDCDIRNEHYYLYVCGNRPDETEGQASCFDFGRRADGRPSRYVPVKVPVFDEIATRKLGNTYRYARQDDLLSEDAKAPEPVYQWVYRPEMQFSVFELSMDAVNKPNNEDPPQIINLLEQQGSITAQTDYVQLLYNLIAPQLQPLQSFGPDRELIFAIGETEMRATMGEDQTLQFDDLSHLAMLDAEDFITMRLYQNSDAANILWEYAFSPIYVEKEDEQYPDVELPWDDYYPSLGDKLITVRSDLSPEELQGRQVRAEIVSAPGEAGLLANGQPQQSLTAAFFQQGGQYKALFKLSGRNLAPSVPSNPGNDNVKIRFTLLSADGSSDEATIEERWFVKNNSNTPLDKVLKGESVFVYDSNRQAFKQDNHKGISAGDARKFDVVQEMLNQVLPRKRTILPGGSVNVASNLYTYIDEDGVFYNQTENAIALFKKHFNLNNETIAGNQNSFNKLMKDYDQVTAAQKAYWRNKLIDKEILAGTQQRSTDVAVNTSINSGDTGLYELYENVVRVFIDSMMAEADRYTTEPTQGWVERGDSNGNTIAHGVGMSYCYGCKDSIVDFNGEVVNCPAQGTDSIIARENDVDQTNYRGNVGTQAATEDQPEQTCQVGAADQGEGQWAGLYARELRRWSKNVAGQAPQAFNPNLWAGIDCSGFAQRVIGAAKKATNGENVTIPSPTSWIGSQDFFTASRVFYQDRVGDQSGQVEQQKRLARGDLVRYFVPRKVAHISIIYSEEADDAGDYRIIHAFGTRKSDHDNDDDTPPVFSRKVIVTGNRATNTIRNPFGYGRIRLWD